MVSSIVLPDVAGVEEPVSVDDLGRGCGVVQVPARCRVQMFFFINSCPKEKVRIKAQIVK